MSSSRRAEHVARRRWSLRARLLVGQVILLVLVVIGIGVATEIALQQFLVHQLDTELTEFEHRSLAELGGGPTLGAPPPGVQVPKAPTDTNGPGPAFLDRRGVQQGSIGAVIVGDTISAGMVDSSGSQTSLSEEAAAQLRSIADDRSPVSLDVAGKGRYRVVADTLWNGDIVITGLPLAPVDATLMRVFVVLVVGTIVVLIIAITVGIWVIRRALAPLDRVAATASLVADLELDRGEVALPVRVPSADTDTRTEVGQLGSAVNRMLDHITNALSARHDSEMRVRQFVADASHELRTPLAAIRGYAELAQRHRDACPDDVANAMSRVDSESRRMTTLVEDLLLLARLDTGRPLEHESVDLTQLTVDAVSDAHIAGPDHRWDLDLPDDPVEIIGDGARLHQVLTNLLANARVHTPPGTTVTVALSLERSSAVLRVVDDGPGIPAELQPEVFERFARGDSSRSRRAGSTGLGLAIAAAVVKSHGGTIGLESRPGRTEFTVRLPL